ncbi:hypothetical protein SUGI_1005490 [Cryptomeria japonica]|nr:hypothetical protein SUGI_1005490 [Cryptomeria japonica]
MENDNNKNPDLTFDAMVEILRRLPLPSLMRAKSVCRAWNTAISATNFNVNNETHHFVIQHRYQGIAFFSASLNRWFPIPLPRTKHKWELCAAAKGLFVFYHFASEIEIVISNVLTKQHRFLPLPETFMDERAFELMVEADHFEPYQ